MIHRADMLAVGAEDFHVLADFALVDHASLPALVDNERARRKVPLALAPRKPGEAQLRAGRDRDLYPPMVTTMPVQVACAMISPSSRC